MAEQAQTKTRVKLKALLYPFHNQTLKLGVLSSRGQLARPPHRVVFAHRAEEVEDGAVGKHNLDVVGEHS